MDQLKKFGLVEKATGPLVPDMEAINRLTLEPLTEEEVFVFRLAASNNLEDRDLERFTERSLRDMARLYVGRTVLFDHVWSAECQVARVYAAEVVEDPESPQRRVLRLVLSCYMMRSAQTQPLIDAIRGGILREVSVGCAVEKVLCSVCGQNLREKSCAHRKGQIYDGERCVHELDGVRDVYEVSFCAVPANAEAGVTKSAAPDPTPAEDTEKSAWDQLLAQMAQVFA